MLLQMIIPFGNLDSIFLIDNSLFPLMHSLI